MEGYQTTRASITRSRAPSTTNYRRVAGTQVPAVGDAGLGTQLGSLTVSRSNMLEAVSRGSVHHVLLYGPPASGKLTVAQALAARTGFRVVHSHLTTDLVSQVLDRGAPGFWDLVKELRLRLFAAAARQGIDVVSTTAYVPEERPWIAEIEAAVHSHGGQVRFAGLRPSVETLEQRVLSQSRLSHRKLQTVESLRAALREADYFSAINAHDLVIDNSVLSADETAKRIVAHFSLLVASGGS